MSLASPCTHPIFDPAISTFRPTRTVLHQADALLGLLCDRSDVPAQLMAVMAEIALFLAQCSQQLRDLNGRRILGTGLSFSRLIAKCSSIPLLVDQLAKFISVVPLDRDYRFELESYIHKARATYEFMQLFESYVSKLQLVATENTGTQKYQEVFVELAWILYIDCRENCIKVDIDAKEDNNCLLASVFYFMIRYSIEYIVPKNMRLARANDKRAFIATILEFLISTFQIEQIDLYMKVADKFDEYVEKLISSSVLKASSSQTDFFSPRIIQLNLRQLQNKYQKKLQPKDIDYRVFRKQKYWSPIHKQALIHRAAAKKLPVSKSMKMEFRSHRALNYQELESPKQNTRYKHNPEAPVRNQPKLFFKKNNEFDWRQNFSTSLVLSPSSTPQGLNAEIYRYVNELSKQSRQQEPSQYHEKSREIIQSILSKTLIENQSISKKSLYFTIYSIYSSLSDRFVPESQNFNKGLLALALFIGHQMYESLEDEKTVSAFYSEMKGEDMVSLWYCIKFFQESDDNMPDQLLNRLSAEQESILTSLIWKNSAYIDEIAELAANYEKSTHFMYFSEKLIEYCEDFLTRMSMELQVSAEHCKYAYNCLKFILSANGNVVENRHIEQILMCCLYIAGKTIGSPILFANIKQSYESLYHYRSINIEDMFNKVYISSHATVDIIQYYNKYFIESVRPFIPYMANPSLSLLHPFFQRQISFEKENIIKNYNCQVSMINIMETTKPKNKKTKEKSNERGKDVLRMVYEPERNQTRIRIRPQNLSEDELCQTERIKNYEGGYSKNQYQ